MFDPQYLTVVAVQVFDLVDGEGKASKVRLSEAFGDKSDLVCVLVFRCVSFSFVVAVRLPLHVAWL